MGLATDWPKRFRGSRTRPNANRRCAVCSGSRSTSRTSRRRKKYHRELVQLARGSAFVAAELGRELAARGELERAELEYRAAVKASSGDARALGPALRDLRTSSSPSEASGRSARPRLQDALRVASHQPGLRRELYELVAEIYRADNRVRDLVKELEGEHPSDAGELGLLASLYEETGQIDKLLATYRRVLRQTPGDLDTRLKVVQLLNIQGALGEVVKEYEALIRPRRATRTTSSSSARP